MESSGRDAIIVRVEANNIGRAQGMKEGKEGSVPSN